MDFYPAGDNPPDQLITDKFLLRPLRPSDVDLDYDAVMENPARLRLSGGGVWPADDFTREANLADLIVHEQEHEDGVAYTFTMMNLAQSRCLGCVYVNQLAKAHRLTAVAEAAPVKVDDRQAIVRYWVRYSLVGDDLDWYLVTKLIEWLNNDWHFSEVYFRAHARDQRQQELMRRAGLPLAYMLEVPDRQRSFMAFGPA
jgi:RimJ/RimL family protein N-acetyltransferase